MHSAFAKAKDAAQCNSNSTITNELFSVAIKVASWLLVCVTLVFAMWAQVLPTNRGDNTRSGANTNETWLTPQNVNKASFGHLFSLPVDYQVMAQPLYIPNVNIPGQGIHNVVYVVTQWNSVYAFDAENGTQLWYANMNNGGQPASVPATLPCGMGQGFAQEGIVGTPVIDLTTNTIYLVAKSVINGTVTHYLHALDITTGNEQTAMGSPIQIVASSKSIKGHVTTFTSLHQKNRPGLLLLNGVLYLGFGSNGCNDGNSGWVLAYNPANLQQLGAFNTSPDHGHTSIWQAGAGLAGDEAGNIFASTAEAGTYDIPEGGQGYSNSVLKLTPPPWTPQNEPDEPADFFTPWNVAYLDANDEDVSSGGPMILPDQSGPPTCSHNPCHELVASGKMAVVYVLDRDNMGHYVPGGQDDVLQEYQLITNGDLDETPAYWNGLLYYAPPAAPIQVLQVSNGVLSLFAQTSSKTADGLAPTISANGNTDGIVWLISGDGLDAYDAISLRQLYTTYQDRARDALPPLPHFVTHTVANGRVYVATRNSVEVYGLLPALSISGGNNQSAPVLTSLESPSYAPLQVLASDPYSGNLLVGVTVNFSDGGKGGSFNPASAITNSNGVATTIYTFPKTSGVYSLSASATNLAGAVATETALPLAAKTMISALGAKQTGAAGSVLPNSIAVAAHDVYGNPVPGVTVSFSTNAGVVNPTSTVTVANGRASTTLQLPTTVGTVKVTASSTGLSNVVFTEYSVAGAPASITVSGGNNQAGQPGTTLPLPLIVVVADQYGNPVSGASVSFSDGGAGGSFSNPNPENTGATGSVSQVYTLPSSPGTVTITATVTGVANGATFTETSQ